MPRNSRNLRIHNVFSFGPQPRIPCGCCPRYFFSLGGRKNHINATHPSSPISPSPNAPSAPPSPSPAPPSPSPTPPGPSPAPQPPSPPPALLSPAPTQQTASEPNRSTPSSSTTFNVPLGPPDRPHIDSDMTHNFLPRSPSNSPQNDAMGMDIDPRSPSPGVNENLDSTPGAKARPSQVRRVYHRQMNGK